MDNSPPKKLRNGCLWIIIFGAMFIACGIWGGYVTSGNLHLNSHDSKELGFSSIVMINGFLFCLIPYFALRGHSWAKPALYILPLPFMVSAGILESIHSLLNLSITTIFVSLIYLLIWFWSIRKLVRTPDVEDYFKAH